MTTTDAERTVARQIRAALEQRLDEMTALLGRMVGVESGSDDPAGLDAMAGLLQELFGGLGALERHPVGPRGASHLLLTVSGADPARQPVAVLGHYDTVWPAGSVDRLPVTVEDGRLSGPGRST